MKLHIPRDESLLKVNVSAVQVSPRGSWDRSQRILYGEGLTGTFSAYMLFHPQVMKHLDYVAVICRYTQLRGWRCALVAGEEAEESRKYTHGTLDWNRFSEQYKPFPELGEPQRITLGFKEVVSSFHRHRCTVELKTWQEEGDPRQAHMRIEVTKQDALGKRLMPGLRLRQDSF
ncbi:hypothetical protein M011DRAFT_482190 [Sporormia fimetaria CBS 119925]|uniref:Uncharacterized protein n=1 Tax=Sporormia fimetaria CBS 119925 TaxID=1340428 RepID=A0A6A6UWN4_9PLEO|nr:hypothetical protein M011DRAFT_482190 [Sporormia fimetaria CBS 119925]